MLMNVVTQHKLSASTEFIFLTRGDDTCVCAWCRQFLCFQASCIPPRLLAALPVGSCFWGNGYQTLQQQENLSGHKRSSKAFATTIAERDGHDIRDFARDKYLSLVHVWRKMWTCRCGQVFFAVICIQTCLSRKHVNKESKMRSCYDFIKVAF